MGEECLVVDYMTAVVIDACLFIIIIHVCIYVCMQIISVQMLSVFQCMRVCVCVAVYV